MSRYIILSEKPWHLENFASLKNRFPDHDWILVNDKDEFILERLEKLNPVKIFIPHWSHIIPSEIFTNFECIVFHMTDLPYGRGGSPLQNLIVRGKKKTKISALKNRFPSPGFLLLNLTTSPSCAKGFKSWIIISEIISSIIPALLRKISFAVPNRSKLFFKYIGPESKPSSTFSAEILVFFSPRTIRF